MFVYGDDLMSNIHLLMIREEFATLTCEEEKGKTVDQTRNQIIFLRLI